jgi:hypothetical protein
MDTRSRQETASKQKLEPGFDSIKAGMLPPKPRTCRFLDHLF